MGVRDQRPDRCRPARRDPTGHARRAAISRHRQGPGRARRRTGHRRHRSSHLRTDQRRQPRLGRPVHPAPPRTGRRDLGRPGSGRGTDEPPPAHRRPARAAPRAGRQLPHAHRDRAHDRRVLPGLVRAATRARLQRPARGPGVPADGGHHSHRGPHREPGTDARQRTRHGRHRPHARRRRLRDHRQLDPTGHLDHSDSASQHSASAPPSSQPSPPRSPTLHPPRPVCARHW